MGTGGRIIALALIGLAACGRPGGEGAGGDESGEAAGAASSEEAALVAAAEDVAGFLRGDVAYDRLRLADSVTLYVAPEGGGGRRTVARAELREPSSWRVRSGGAEYDLAPPPGLDSLTTRPGRHLSCMEYDLATRVPELADLPHVGTKLEPAGGASSCLQTWNLTLVFDSTGPPPRLVAAVYDQWEW